MRDILKEYLAGNPDILPFFNGTPARLFAEAPSPTPREPALTEAIVGYNERLGGRPQFTGREAVVITGQQPGLFSGPLYNIFKALTAIRAARRIEETSGIPCAPIYWVAGDDHDFEEARTACFLTKRHEPLALTYDPGEPVSGRSLFRVHLEASLHDLVDQAARRTRGSEHREEIAQFLHESLDASASLAGWSARIMARLFRDTPLILFTPHIPAARKLARTVLERELSDPLASTALLNETGAKLKALGYPQQVVKSPEECNFYVEMGERRRKVLFQNGRYHFPEEDLSCAPAELEEILNCSPERFSANVALRCIVQQHLFAPLAYVAGPGEVAYWAQLKPVFHHFDHTMPTVYPRARAVLTTSKGKAILADLGLSLDALTEAPDSLVDRVLKHTVDSPARQAFEAGRSAVEEALSTLAAALDAHDAQAAAMAERVGQRAANGLNRVEKAIVHGDETRAAATRKRIERLRNTFAPFGKPQERVYTVISFLFEHGWGLIPRLEKALDIDSFAMNEVEL